MKLVAYLRVSTTGQATDGYGLDIQKAAVKDWAKTNGHRIVAWHRDEGVSGAKEPADRPGLSDALSDISSHEADGLVVHSLDRLSRTLTTQEAVLGQIWERTFNPWRPDAARPQVFAVQDGGLVPEDDPDDPMRTAMRQMRGVFIQLDRQQIIKRLRDGRRAKAAKGEYAGGRPPYGFMAKDGQLVENPAESGHHRQILAWSKTGTPYLTIAQSLNRRDVPTRTGKGRWHAKTVAGIVKRGT